MIKHSLWTESHPYVRKLLHSFTLSDSFRCVCVLRYVECIWIVRALDPLSHYYYYYYFFYMFILFVENSAHFYYTLIVVTGVETDILRNQTWYAVSNGSAKCCCLNRTHHRHHHHHTHKEWVSLSLLILLLVAVVVALTSSSLCLLAFASCVRCSWLLTCLLNGFFVLFHFTCAYRSNRALRRWKKESYKKRRNEEEFPCILQINTHRTHNSYIIIYPHI